MPLGSPSTIPTSDVETSTPTSPAISDVSTVPVTECDRSSVVSPAQMGEGSNLVSIAIPLSQSSSIPAPDRTSAGQTSQLRIRVSPSCSQVLGSKPRTVVDRYQSMEAALEQQMIQNSQLNEELQELRTSASPFVQFVQSKYDRVCVRYED
uniref:Uncharacterized protein n=1 Tax=Peronospora matthiolae TaxID=2874970 RepID=A0AAV1U1Z7_9STRA